MPSIGVPVSVALDQNRALNSSRIAIIGLRQKLPLAGLRRTSDYIDQPVALHRDIKTRAPSCRCNALAEHGVELRDIVGPRPRRSSVRHHGGAWPGSAAPRA